MSRNYYTAIITHGDLAKSFEQATKNLIVSATKVFYYSNKKLSLEEIEKEIEEERARLKPVKSVFFY